jgi:hypothetical protein
MYGLPAKDVKFLFLIVVPFFIALLSRYYNEGLAEKLHRGAVIFFKGCRPYHIRSISAVPEFRTEEFLAYMGVRPVSESGLKFFFRKPAAKAIGLCTSIDDSGCAHLKRCIKAR